MCLRKFDILGQNEGLDYLIEMFWEQIQMIWEHLEKLYARKSFIWDSKWYNLILMEF